MNPQSSGMQCANYCLDFSSPKIMGIVNVTPDSFSDGGLYATTGAAVDHALELIEDGADILDIGGESTRPNAAPVTPEEEIARVMPVLEALMPHVNVPISIDTSSPELMNAAIKAGASIINDVRSFSRPGALDAVARSKVGVVIMHMLAEPGEMQNDPQYQDVMFDIKFYLAQRAKILQEAGVQRNRICVDPGIGFGKTTRHDCQILQQLEQLGELNLPILSGSSRKKFIGAIINQPIASERVAASVASAVISVLNGANIVRVHDVKATVDALRITQAIQTLNIKEVINV